jgi:hypothetical protein
MRPLLLSTLTALALAAPAAAADVRTASGTVVSVSDSAITVRSDRSSLTCGIGARSPAVALLANGDRVAIACRRSGASWILTRARLLPPPPAPKPGGDSAPAPKPTGNGHSDPKPSPKPTGDGNPEPKPSPGPRPAPEPSTAPKPEPKPEPTPEPKPDPAPTTPPPVVTTAGGQVTALSATSLTIHNGEHDLTLTCTVTDASPSLGDYHVGDRVRVYCTTAGVLVAIARL